MQYVDPDAPLALHIAQKVFFKQRKNSQAYAFARRGAEVDPRNPYVWATLGMHEQDIYRFDQADKWFRKAEALAQTSAHRDDALGVVYLNRTCMLVQAGRWKEAEEVGRKSLALTPNSAKAKANLGLACLALGKWEEGWPLYDAIIGFDQSRKKVSYTDQLVEWDGSKQNIVIYGEQGLGDEISFSSMVPDAIEAAKSVVIDCAPKLEGLFRRSFPKATVYGTLHSATGRQWDKPHDIDASVSIGGLGKLFRKSPSACPGSPWLIADPDRVAMWQGLWSKQGKPVIGVAWSGGVPWTGDRNRRFSLDELLPIFRSVDAVWICLEYRDAGREIQAFKAKHPEIDLRQYPFGTLTSDYDDTAALVASLDHVVSMQTSVIHLAGALGTPCYCFVNKHGQWRYGTEGDSMPWYKSVKLYRNVTGWPIDDAAKDLRAKFADPIS